MADPGASLGIEGVSDAVEVGRGGFAIVYRAHQPAFDRTVAVKVLNSIPDETSLQRFQREVRAMGKLSEHPAIATVLDAGTTPDGRPYLLMPFLSGGSLMDSLRAGMSYDPRAAAQLGVALSGALHAAHTEGILHRDVKPANIMVGRYGDPLLVDFGIARIAGGHETTTGVVTATLSHAAPELLDGHAPSVASDVYALGSTLYTLVSGRPPFSVEGDESVVPLIARIMSNPVPPLPGEAAESGLQAVLERAMAKDPADRHPTAAALGEALAAVVRGDAPADPPPPLPTDRPPRALPVDDPIPPVPDATTPAAAAAAEAEAAETRHFTAPPSTPGADRPSRRTALLVGAAALALVVVVGLVMALRGGDDQEPADDVPTTVASITAPEDPGGGAVDAGDVPTNGVDSVELGLLQAPASTADITPNTVLQVGMEPGMATALQFDVDQPGRSIRISTLQEGEVDPIVALYRDGELVGADDDGSPDGNDVLLDLPDVPPGRYEARFAGLRDVSGALNVSLQVVETDPMDGEQTESLDEGHEVDVYRVQVQPGQARGLEVESADEVLLRAVTEQGEFLTSSSGSDVVAVDLTDEGPGTFFVYVSPLGDTASYTARPLITNAASSPVAPGLEVDALPTLDQAGREVEAAPTIAVDLADGEVVAIPFSNSDEDGVLHVVTRSTDVDTLLLLHGPDGALLAASDDEGGGDSGTDSVIDFPLDVGDHTLLLTSFDRVTGGTVDVTFAVVPPRPLDAGGGEIERPDLPQVYELAVGPGMPPPDRIQVQAGFDLTLRLLDEDGGIVDVTDTGGNPPIETAALPQGEYVLVVTADEPGSYVLAVS